MAHRVLVPLDGSDLAEQAIPWADELASDLHAEVELVRVIDQGLFAESREAEIRLNGRLSQPGSEGVAARATALRIENLERDVHQALTGARSKFQRPHQIETTVLHGPAAEAIVAHARARGATLIVMASHGRTGLARTVLGSVAGAVVRDSGIPVCVVRHDLLMPAHAPRRVLVPLDTSDLAEAALRRVLPLARELRWRLVLFSAVELPPQTFPIQGAALPLGLPPTHTPAEIADYLDQLRGELRGVGADAQVRVGVGEPAQAILRAAEDARVGLIAMSTHGRNGIGRWLMGSVAEAVIHQSSVPVLAVGPAQAPLPEAETSPSAVDEKHT